MIYSGTTTVLCFLITVTFNWIAADNERTFKIGVVCGEGMLPSEAQRQIEQATSKQNSGVSIKLSWLVLNSTGHNTNYKTVDDFIRTNLDGVITILNCYLTIMVSKITRNVPLPHISASVYHCDSSRDHTLNLGGGSAIQTNLVTDLIGAAGWSDMGIVFDDTVVSVQRNRIMFALSAAGAKTNLAVLNTESKRSGELGKALKMMPHQILVMAQRDSVSDLFKEVTELEMTSLQYAWILITDDISPEAVSLLLGPSSNGNLVLVQPQEALCSCCSDNLHQSLCATLEDNFGSRIVSRLGETLCLFYWAFRQTLDRDFARTGYGGSCSSIGCFIQVRLHQKVLSRKSLFDVTEIRQFPKKQIRHIGTWTESHGLKMLTDDEKVLGNINDFGGKTLTVAVDPHSAPYVSRSDGGKHKGMAIDILEDLAFSLNFAYKLVESADGYYGSPTKNLSWNGMIGMVMRGEADMAVGPFTVTHQRAEVIDFTTAFMQQSVGILTPTTENSPQLFQFLKPFSLLVWVVILAFIALSGVCLFLINYTTRPKYEKKRPRPSPKEVNFMENIVLVISSISGQGPTFHPEVLSARCLLGVWLLFTELVLSMYTAHLAAVLTVATPIKPIDSLQDLDSRREIGIVVEYGTSTWTLFEQSKVKLYRRINAKKVSIKNSERGVELVKKGRHCYIGGRVSLLFHVAKSCGEIRVANEQFFSSSYAFVLPKHSPYRDPINLRIIKLLEYGIIKGLKGTWMNPSSNCSEKKDKFEGSVSLDMYTLGGVFVVYGIIAALAVQILIAENLQAKLRRKSPPPSPPL